MEVFAGLPENGRSGEDAARGAGDARLPQEADVLARRFLWPLLGVVAAASHRRSPRPLGSVALLDLANVAVQPVAWATP
jgi:hypothetical protein